jgi:mRNA-degrading endonuclease RelE of RelBE toxin-antitoxin system
MKKIYFDKRAEKELKEFSESVQIEFTAYITILKQKGKLDFPESKKLDKNLFEIRFKLGG